MLVTRKLGAEEATTLYNSYHSSKLNQQQNQGQAEPSSAYGPARWLGASADNVQEKVSWIRGEPKDRGKAQTDFLETRWP